jgi:hypothetical protein
MPKTPPPPKNVVTYVYEQQSQMKLPYYGADNAPFFG